jgi:hypothetical protein
MKILLHPGEILAAFLARAAVAAGRFASDRSDELTRLERGSVSFHDKKNGNHRGHMPSVKGAAVHTATLAESEEATPDNNGVANESKVFPAEGGRVFSR